jgi:hypothetical protein
MQLSTTPQMSTGTLSYFSTPKKTGLPYDKRDEKGIFCSSRTLFPSKFKFNKRKTNAPKSHPTISSHLPNN